MVYQRLANGSRNSNLSALGFEPRATPFSTSNFGETSILLSRFPAVRQVIQLVLRAAVGLPNAVVRHLAQVEEKVAESLAWARDSPLWEEIRANEGQLPTCQQVCDDTHKKKHLNWQQVLSRRKLVFE